jgi:hypothetical protein
LVRKFTSKDIEIINVWVKSRGMPGWNIYSLPVNGFIVEGIAAGFVYLTDSEIAILDCVVSNPLASGYSRGKAVKNIVIRLIECAKSNGRININCTTQIKSMKKMMLSLGFSECGSFEAFTKEF